jgi:hypothetical protein
VAHFIAGEDYYFVSVAEMEAEIQKGSFIEAGKYNDQLYGTSISSIRHLSGKVLPLPLLSPVITLGLRWWVQFELVISIGQFVHCLNGCVRQIDV